MSLFLILFFLFLPLYFSHPSSIDQNVTRSRKSHKATKRNNRWSTKHYTVM